METLRITDGALRERLMNLYLSLESFPEVPDVLRRLKATGIKTAILSNGTREMLRAVLWLIVVGIAGAAPVALVPMVTAETLGLKRFGTLFGWLGSVVTVGMFIGPLLVGWMTDVTGSYTTPFELCALICLVGSAASFLCTVPRPAELTTTAEATTSISTA
jgi:MFS family permease